MTISNHQTSFTNGNVAPLMTHFVNFWFWPMAVDDGDPGRMNFCPFQNTSKIFKVYSCVPYLKHAWRIDPRPASNVPKKGLCGLDQLWNKHIGKHFRTLYQHSLLEISTFLPFLVRLLAIIWFKIPDGILSQFEIYLTFSSTIHNTTIVDFRLPFFHSGGEGYFYYGPTTIFCCGNVVLGSAICIVE